jgi:hypothetical protein
MSRKWGGNCVGRALLELVLHGFGNVFFLVANQSMVTNSSDAKMAEGIESKGSSDKGQQVGRQTGRIDMESILKLGRQEVEELGHKI